MVTESRFLQNIQITREGIFSGAKFWCKQSDSQCSAGGEDTEFHAKNSPCVVIVSPDDLYPIT